MTSEGQIHGGIVHGIGNALYEKMIYDGNGQPLTTNFADYLLPAATETPQIEVLFNESLSPLNPLGMKGVGEVSIVPVTSAIVSAIEDALKPIGIKINEVPISPVRLVELIMEKEKLAQLV
jgi:carbon-monoxide dehydrogenase large subunit